MIADSLALFGVLLTFVGIFGAISLATNHWGLSPEFSRKAGHILMGLVCLSFPWLFLKAWPLVLLCLGSVSAFLWIRMRGEILQSVFHRVVRPSYGELFFPISVLVLYLVKEQTVVDYVIPILLLTLADAIGALVGVRFGKNKFGTDEGFKSWEGSVAFLIVAFSSTTLSLIFLTDFGFYHALIIALLMGLILMIVEAIAWRGLDNLFIPLGAFVLLNIYQELSVAELLARALILLVVTYSFWLVRRWTFARDGTMLASALCLYIFWTYGGWQWTLAPLALLAGYIVASPNAAREKHLTHGLTDLGAVVGAGMFWLFMSVTMKNGSFTGAFFISWAAQLTMILCASFTWRYPGMQMRDAILRSTGLCIIVFLIPLVTIFGVKAFWFGMPVLVLACGITAFIYWKFEWEAKLSVDSPGRAPRQFLYGFGASILGLTLSGL